MTRIGTARTLVLLGSGLQLGFGAVTSFLTLVFGPLALHRPAITGSIVLGVVAFVVIIVLDIALANLLAARAASVPRALAGGCGTLVAGTAVAVAALVLVALR